MKYIKNDKHDPSWAAQEVPMFVPASSVNLIYGLRHRRSQTGYKVEAGRRNEHGPFLGCPGRIMFVILYVFHALAVQVLNRDTGFLRV